MSEATGRRPTRIAVLASGGGSNLAAILSHHDALGSRRSGSVVLVASDRPDAPALDRARSRGIAALHIDAPSDSEGLLAMLIEHEIELIALAGYLRLIPAPVTQRFRGRLVNIHPALLPAFGGPGMYGHSVHRAVLDAGAQLSGASAHFVDEEYDRGALIAQWPVPVLRGDTPRSLAARVLQVEHLLYPRVVDAVARGDIMLDEDHRVRYRGTSLPDGLMFALTSNDTDSVAHSIDLALG